MSADCPHVSPIDHMNKNLRSTIARQSATKIIP